MHKLTDSHVVIDSRETDPEKSANLTLIGLPATDDCDLLIELSTLLLTFKTNITSLYRFKETTKCNFLCPDDSFCGKCN